MAKFLKTIGSLGERLLQAKNKGMSEVPGRYESIWDRMLNYLSYLDFVGLLGILKDGKFDVKNLLGRNYRKEGVAKYQKRVINWISGQTGVDPIDIATFLHNDKDVMPLEKASNKEIEEIKAKVENSLSHHYEDEYEIILEDDDWDDEQDTLEN